MGAAAAVLLYAWGTIIANEVKIYSFPCSVKITFGSIKTSSINIVRGPGAIPGSQIKKYSFCREVAERAGWFFPPRSASLLLLGGRLETWWGCLFFRLVEEGEMNLVPPETWSGSASRDGWQSVWTCQIWSWDKNGAAWFSLKVVSVRSHHVQCHHHIFCVWNQSNLKNTPSQPAHSF